jgi:branched-chain amino acid transport system permease protein
MRVGGAARLKRDSIATAVIVVLYLAAASLVHNSYYQLILTLVPIWAALGLGWNLFSGMSGLISFGHASFFGIGAYTVT